MVIHKVTVEVSQLFAYHALDTICGRRPRVRWAHLLLRRRPPPSEGRKASEGADAHAAVAADAKTIIQRRREGGRAASFVAFFIREDRPSDRPEAAAADCPPYRVLLGGDE